MADAKDVKAKYRHHRIRSAMTGKDMSWPPARKPEEVSKASGSRRIFTIKHQGEEADPFNISLTRRRLKRHRRNHQDMMANRSIQAHKDAAAFNAGRRERGLKPHEA